MAEHLVGQRIKRREDPRFLTGRAAYVGDLRLSGALAVVLLRSAHAHARITRVDAARARAHPGVLRVVTGTDLEGRLGPVPCAVPLDHAPVHPVLALGCVRFVGEPVVALVAESPAAAQDALAEIEAEYEPLPPVTDPTKALDPGSPLVHPSLGTNVAAHSASRLEEFARAAAGADHVRRFRLANQRVAPVPIEPRGVAAVWDAGTERLTVYSSTQAPHLLRIQLAAVLGMSERALRVVAPDVGGAFGSKVNVYSEEVLLAWLAVELGRPVTWIEERREHFTATTHGRDLLADVEVAFNRDGGLVAIKVGLLSDLGAYPQLLTPMIAAAPARALGGCYRFEVVAFEQTMVFTNKMATDSYRGAGKPEATYIVERTMDLVAAELGLDSADMRRRNFIPADAFPYTTATGYVLDSGAYEASLDAALRLVEYESARRWQAEQRRRGRLVGIGLSSWMAPSATGPSALLPPGLKVGGWEAATIRVDPDASVTVWTGVSPHGQGQETAFAQLAADALGVGIDDVTVVYGDTDTVTRGVGTFGSRGTALGGTAVFLALEQLRDRLKRVAAPLLGARPEELRLSEGQVVVTGAPRRSVALRRVVEEAWAWKTPVPGGEPGLVASAVFEPPAFAWPFGTHIAIVQVERETGLVRIVRYAAVDDFGCVVNPLLLEGQLHGGIAQGIGQALWEGVAYDSSGQLVTITLADYAVPRAGMLPSFRLDRTVTPTPTNPLGVKGAGEAGAIASTPCIVSAVMDALAPLGVRHLDMPLTPERVWRAMREGSGTAGRDRDAAAKDAGRR